MEKFSKVIYSKSSHNNKYGVPISLSEINLSTKFGIFEIGMDKKGEIYSLSKIVKPNVGIITNITYAHSKNFKNLNHIAKAKSEIIDNIVPNGMIILNYDDKYFKYFKKKAETNKIKVRSFGFNKKSDIHFLKSLKSGSYYKIFISCFNNIFTFNVKKELFNYKYNILAAIALISYYYDLKDVNRNIFLNYKIPNGRGNLKKVNYKNKKFYFLDESYNSNPLSLSFALNRFQDLGVNSSRKIILIGDMLELGKFSIKQHENIGKFINNLKIDKVYVYGGNIIYAYNKIRTQKQGKVLKSKNDINNFFENELKDGDYLMIKGSNATGLHNIAKKLKRDKFSVI